jgi:hypothetical protein
VRDAAEEADVVRMLMTLFDSGDDWLAVPADRCDIHLGAAQGLTDEFDDGAGVAGLGGFQNGC